MAEKGAESVDFVAQFRYFGSAFAFLAFQLLLQLLDLYACGLVFVAEFAFEGVVFDVLAGVLELCKFVVEVLILPFKLSLSHIELHEFDFGTGCVGCAA